MLWRFETAAVHGFSLKPQGQHVSSTKSIGRNGMQINLKYMLLRIRCLLNFRDNATDAEFIDAGYCIDSRAQGVSA
jgi:hypothetical protein